MDLGAGAANSGLLAGTHSLFCGNPAVIAAGRYSSFSYSQLFHKGLHSTKSPIGSISFEMPFSLDLPKHFSSRKVLWA